MPYIPRDAQWYLADVVEEITVDGEANNVVHINTILIRADSPEEAYAKAMAGGEEGNTSYLNPDGQMVTIRFRGLRNLDVIHEELEDGAELFYDERVGVAEDELRGYLKAKDQLSVFRSFSGPAPGRPNYAAGDIVEEAEALLAAAHGPYDPHEQREGPLASIAYPPAPWQAVGQAWVGLFHTDVPTALPAGVASVFGSRWKVIALVRYQTGSTLRYDELIVGTLARVGLRVGLYVEFIAVDSLASLSGGRRIWGLPKTLATFVWEGDACRISDDSGPIATLHVNQRHGWLPPLPLAAIGIGRLGDRWAVLTAPGRGRLTQGGLRIAAWSLRFGYRPARRPLFACAAQPFRATFPAPKLITDSHRR